MMMRPSLARTVVETVFSRSFSKGVGGRPRRFRWVWDVGGRFPNDGVDFDGNDFVCRHRRRHHRASSSSSSKSFASSCSDALKKATTTTTTTTTPQKEGDDEGRRPHHHHHHHHVSVVVGSNRGIGFAFVKHLLESNATIVGAHRAHGTVVATCRRPSEARALHALRERFGFAERLDIVRVDVLDEKTIEDAANFAREKYGRVDLLVHAAGVLHEPDGKMVPETSIARFDAEACVASYRTNAIGPMLVTKHFSKVMLKTADENDETKPVPAIANVSARVSSISDNKLGGWYSYRGGKTALNQMTRTAHVEFSRKKNPIAMILLHPGTVDTELSAPFKKNVPEGKLFTPEYSAGKLLEVLKDVTLKESGKFYDYAGVEIPW